MTGGLTQSEIEEWVRKDSANSITDTSQFLYRIAANIPADIFKLLMGKQEEGSLYFGSVLRITEINKKSSYTLGFYTVKNIITGEFIISRANYSLLNYSVDWKKYIDSTEYINLEITIDNLDITNKFYAQSTKIDNEYGLVQHNKTPNITEGRSAIFRGNRTIVFYSRTTDDINNYVQIPGEIYISFGITPSILKLAQYNPISDDKKIKKTEKQKEIKNNVLIGSR